MKGNRKKTNLISEPFTQRNTFTLDLNNDNKKKKHPQQHKECQNIPHNNNNYNNNHKIK